MRTADWRVVHLLFWVQPTKTVQSKCLVIEIVLINFPQLIIPSMFFCLLYYSTYLSHLSCCFFFSAARSGHSLNSVTLFIRGRYVLRVLSDHVLARMQSSSLCYQQAPYGSLQDGHTDGHSGGLAASPGWHRQLPISSSPPHAMAAHHSHIRRISDLSISNEMI